MRRAQRFGLEVWDFVVGDDWRLAAAVVIGIAAAAALAGAGVAAWWVLPVLIPLVLLVSLRASGR